MALANMGGYEIKRYESIILEVVEAIKKWSRLKDKAVGVRIAFINGPFSIVIISITIMDRLGRHLFQKSQIHQVPALTSLEAH